MLTTILPGKPAYEGPTLQKCRSTVARPLAPRLGLDVPEEVLSERLRALGVTERPGVISDTSYLLRLVFDWRREHLMW